jgi:hypothetical protein
VSQLIYVEGAGFRRPGVRDAHLVTVERAPLRLTVRRFVSGPDGVHASFDIVEPGIGASCYVPTEGRNAFDPGKITFRAGKHEQSSTMTRSAMAIEGGLRYVVQSFRELPREGDVVEMALAGGYFGDWQVTIPVVELGGPEGELVPRDAEAQARGITVRVTGMSTTTEATAVLFTVDAGPRRHVDGVGGLHDRRDGPSALRLTDDRGHSYEERHDLDIARPSGDAHLAVFAPLANNPREVVLEIPFVYVTKRDAGSVDVTLPLTAPLEIALGAHRFRIRSVGPAPDSLRRRNFGPALAIDVDMGAPEGEARVLYPCAVLVDGQNRGMGYGNGINATDPTPVETIEVRMPDPEAVRRITFQGVVLQLRGPWTVRFPA